MIARTEATRMVGSRSRTADASRAFPEGVAAGIVGALTVAIWFLILDAINGQPLHTPTVLGTALFRRGQGLDSPAGVPVSLEMVLMFSWVHVLVFGIIGEATSRLLSFAERNANLGFGILLLFVVCESGFLAAAMIFAEPMLHALAWSAILVANLLAAASMGGYFWLRHPNLKIRP